MPARLFISLVAAICAGFVAVTVHELSASDSILPPLLHEMFLRSGLADDEVLWPAVLLILGWACFRSLRRHPLGVARVLWALAVFDFLIVILNASKVLHDADIDPTWYWFGLNPPSLFVRLEAFVWLLLPALGLTIVAGELTHASIVHLLREELHEALDYTPDHYDRIVHRQRLIRTVRGPNPPLFVVLSRFFVLLFIPVPFCAKIAALSWEIRVFPHELRSPSLITSEASTKQPGLQRLAIDVWGNAAINGDVLAVGSDKECLRLTSWLASAPRTPPAPLHVGLVVHPTTDLQRIVEILTAIQRAGVRHIVFIAEPPP